MRSFRLKILPFAFGVLSAVVPQAQADVITYQISDIGGFAAYQQANVGQTYSGTGFVGLYSFDSFAHLFGLEPLFSRTALEVDISGIAGAVINSATLSFALLDGSPGAKPLTVTSFDATGSLGYFFIPPSVLGSISSVTQFGSNTIDVTSLVQSRVAGGFPWLGLHLASDAGPYSWTYTTPDPDRASGSLHRLLSCRRS